MSLENPLNRYVCQSCGQSIITIDRDNGVTPFMLGCRVTEGCGGVMCSSMYNGVSGEPSYEWRRPTPQEYSAMSQAMKEHIDRGGLEIYPIRI